MKGEAQTLHEQLRRARRSQGITQSQLARETKCSQSAISMWESGREDALSGRAIKLMAERLGVALVSAEVEAPGVKPMPLKKLKYCPIDECPSNIPYTVRGNLHFKPRLVECDTDQSMRCTMCGELLEECCPNQECGQPLGDGAFCLHCGTPYVTATLAMRGHIDQWVVARRREIDELWTMSRSQRLGA